ncbi:BRO family [Leptopilina boulardi filamentous virus]|uniref:BRO family n=1 Tax=Leptopilina boulardi filamentous virus TaxID=552509 RepID=A0A1S5YD65_9VIRU|nr:BRO family [Leptopilina boulardi filamentous virus]AQQ79934.1 BRO family [Leptopilina boulardi filamentous virus]
MISERFFLNCENKSSKFLKLIMNPSTIVNTLSKHQKYRLKKKIQKIKNCELFEITDTEIVNAMSEVQRDNCNSEILTTLKFSESQIMRKKISFLGNEFRIFSIMDLNNELWFFSKTFLKRLNYNDDKQAIYNNVSLQNYRTYGQLRGRPSTKSRDKHITKYSKFINSAGLFELIQKSKSKNTEPFYLWVKGLLVPSLYNAYNNHKILRIFKKPNGEYKFCHVERIKIENLTKRIITEGYDKNYLELDLGNDIKGMDFIKESLIKYYEPVSICGNTRIFCEIDLFTFLPKMLQKMKKTKQ